MRRALFVFLAVAALAATALAADVTGKWAGTFTPENGDSQSAFVVLKQAGTALTGTAGPDEDRQWPIKVGKIEGSKVTVEVQSPEDGAVYKVELVLNGDRMTGDITASQGDRTMKGKMELSRAK